MMVASWHNSTEVKKWLVRGLVKFLLAIPWLCYLALNSVTMDIMTNGARPEGVSEADSLAIQTHCEWWNHVVKAGALFARIRGDRGRGGRCNLLQVQLQKCCAWADNDWQGGFLVCVDILCNERLKLGQFLLFIFSWHYLTRTLKNSPLMEK